MPELPEVETLRRSLKPLEGKRIQKIHLSRLAPVETTTAAAIRKALTGRRLTGRDRWGKYLLLKTNSFATLVLHLGMSGQLRLYPHAPFPRVPHLQMEIDFYDDSRLYYVDPRRFGTLSLSFARDYSDNAFLQRLGPDYLDPKLDERKFISQCRRHPGITIKSLTLHQGIAAGLGNIYGCEALYRARLDPRKRVGELSDRQLGRLLHAARAVLADGIRYGGASIRDYLDGNGHRGEMKQFLRVYDREGRPSLDGKGKVKRIVQNARSTWFVPQVQQ